jgi:hypothetical protein
VLGQATAYACYTEYLPASTPGGIGASMTFTAVMPTEPYAPSSTDLSGPYTCTLLYHQYFATPGCGGFSVDVTFDNVEAQPGFIAGTPDPTFFSAYADTARTFGCRTADGDFDWNTAFVVTTTHTDLFTVFVTAEAYYLLSELHAVGGNDGPSFYANFAPVPVTCPAGETATQRPDHHRGLARLRQPDLDLPRSVLRLSGLHSRPSRRNGRTAGKLTEDEMKRAGLRPRLSVWPP